MNKGPIPPLPAIDAPTDMLAEARRNCADRCRERREHDLAASFERGEQDQGWAIRHEVARLKLEAENG